MKRVLLILSDGFEEIEALGTCDILRRLQISVTLSGLDRVNVQSAHGMQVAADCVLSAIPDVSQFDAIVLPGGLPGATNLFASEKVEKLLKEAAQGGKVTAAICAAPIVLDKAGLLKIRRFTMYPAPDLKKYLSDGNVPSDDLVTVDGTVITGKGPGATPLFASAIAEALGIPAEQCEAVLASMFF